MRLAHRHPGSLHHRVPPRRRGGRLATQVHLGVAQRAVHLLQIGHDVRRLPAAALREPVDAHRLHRLVRATGAQRADHRRRAVLLDRVVAGLLVLVALPPQADLVRVQHAVGDLDHVVRRPALLVHIGLQRRVAAMLHLVDVGRADELAHDLRERGVFLRIHRVVARLVARRPPGDIGAPFDLQRGMPPGGTLAAADMIPAIDPDLRHVFVLQPGRPFEPRLTRHG